MVLILTCFNKQVVFAGACVYGGSGVCAFSKYFSAVETWVTLSNCLVLKYASGPDTFTQEAQKLRLDLRTLLLEWTTKLHS